MSARNRKFSVRSVYKAVVEFEQRNMASSSSTFPNIYGDSRRFWNLLRGIAVPPRVGLFIWRACIGAVPTLEILLALEVDTQYAFCLEPGLFSCPTARVVWASSNISWRSLSIRADEVSESIHVC
ncbi:hypothetical protein Salat_2520700 [Sesamum alatum]|uniref:Reverse transcriptase zinc-binding domain-containing protein n=1 Tax=Sesamum alatum TaxID=300844 RepID=A0AAE1XSU3_9LAMI|nr:hypothetical protein Salat_2520700 [Sesamum alatum]